MIKEFITDMAKILPIVWDRFTVEDGNYDIYGWIARKDGQRDFVLLQLYIDNGVMKGGFCTSSAKYSKHILMLLYGTTKGHSPCKKIEQFPEV